MEWRPERLQKGVQRVCVVEVPHVRRAERGGFGPTKLLMSLFPQRKHYFMLSHSTGAKTRRRWSRKTRNVLSELIWMAGWLLVAFGVLIAVPVMQRAGLVADYTNPIVSALDN